MELTVDQALQQGIAAHREGKLQEAERLYRSILKVQPNHAHANHNLGVLAVSVGKVVDALPFFEQALESNTHIEQFWLSYIDALIKLQRSYDAKQALTDAEQLGVSAVKLDELGKLLRVVLPKDLNKAEEDQTPLETREAQGATSDATRPQHQINTLLEHYQKGRLEEAEALAESLTQQFPGHPSGWKVLGLILRRKGRLDESLLPMQKSVELSPHDAAGYSNLGVTLRDLGRLKEAEASYQQAIALKPDFVDAHCNLGNTLREMGKLEEAEKSYTQAIATKPDCAEAHGDLGVTLNELNRFDEAEASYRQAILLKPDYFNAHNNLGNLLRELGRLDEAETSYRQAIALKPDFAEAHNNLGVTLTELGKLGLAISSYVCAINLKPDFHNAYDNLGAALKSATFNEEDQSLYPILINLLTQGNFVRPSYIAKAILSLLRQDARISSLMLNTSALTDITKVEGVLKTLNQLPLLQHLMRICPLPDRQFEELFASIRRTLLVGLGQITTSDEFICFLSTLSLHCFTNEYVYFESEEETKLIRVLEKRIAENATQDSHPAIVDLLCLATYRPLHKYDWSAELQELNQLPEVQRRLIEEPRSEIQLAREMPVLADVEDDISLKVREQYEENPYPRWEKLGLPSTPKSVAKVCDESKIHLHSQSIKNVFSPSILVAGCGTGQQSIEVASRFANCQVTAVDLSRASLAYAFRKTDELCISNIKYFQADILSLGKLGQEFDLIVCTGVLHHMNDPMAGWRVLVDRLNTGGLMKVGLYSELARSHIAKIRQEIAIDTLEKSEAELRLLRRSLVKSDDAHVQRTTFSSDFFSLSMFRDLIFHVQEHRFTLPKIQRCLNNLGLEFCGFDNAEIVSEFERSFGEGSDTCDLSLWHQFEKSHPSTFASMYQFWCQKL